MEHSIQSSVHPSAELSHAFGPPPPAPHSAHPSVDPSLLPGTSPYADHHPFHTSVHPADVALQTAGASSLAAADKRKLDVEPAQANHGHPPGSKRRRYLATGPNDYVPNENEGPNGGPKHWTDEEKTKLFQWVMGPGRDIQFNNLRASKNSCLRECSQEIFAGRKTYQALKGAFERSFALFRQIYAFEKMTENMRNPALQINNPVERQKDIEQRMQVARDKGFEFGTLNPRIIDQWHRLGWYALFLTRYDGDPCTTATTSHPHSRPFVGGAMGHREDDDVPTYDVDEPDVQSPQQTEQHIMDPVKSMSLETETPVPPRPPTAPLRTPFSFEPRQTAPLPPIDTPLPTASAARLAAMPPAPTVAVAGGGAGGVGADDLPSLATLTQTMLSFLKTQGQMVEYMKQRDARERELEERARRRDQERKEESQAGLERMKQKAELASSLVSNPAAEPGVKKAAAEFLTRMFMVD